jgi:hypothetical protein
MTGAFLFPTPHTPIIMNDFKRSVEVHQSMPSSLKASQKPVALLFLLGDKIGFSQPDIITIHTTTTISMLRFTIIKLSSILSPDPSTFLKE